MADRLAADTADDASTDALAGDEDALFLRLKRWTREAQRHLSDWRGEAEESFGFVSGDQWSKEDKAKLMEMQRVPIVFNRVQPITDSVAGMEVGNRQEVHFYPREVADSGKNELLSSAAKFFRQESDTEDEESDAFYDCLVCGIGATEIRPDYEIDPEGALPTDRLDPLSVFYDPSARKRNLVDRRYGGYAKEMPLSDARALFPDADDADLHAGWATVAEIENQPHNADPSAAYNQGADGGGMGGNVERKKVTVVYIEWWDRETRMMTVDPFTRKRAEFTKAQHGKLKARLAAFGVDLPGVEITRKVFKNAFLGAKVLKTGPGRCPDEFTVNFITGKRDRNRNTWYGIVAAMKDPQRWANKFFSQIHHIISSNAKGGLVVETDAVENTRQFENTWADPSGITWVRPGSIGKEKIQPKPAITYPSGLDKMMEYAISSIRDVTGVNLELLGMADREQAGVLEYQRKQAGITILAGLFDSLRRYRKIQGRVLLYLIQKYVPDGRLIRIDSENGPKYAPLVKDPEGTKYDVIVDEAPTSPNQKEATWMMVMQLMPMLGKLPLPPPVWLELLRYSPLPESLTGKIGQIVKQASQQGPPPDPRIVKVQQDGQIAAGKLKIENARAMADIEATRAAALVDIVKAGAASGAFRIDQANALIDAISGMQDQAHGQALAAQGQAHDQMMDRAQFAHDQQMDQQAAAAAAQQAQQPAQQ